MSDPIDATTRFRKCLVCLLLGGLALLLCEIRFEHREVLAERWHAYLPLAYAEMMLPVGAASLVGWEKWGRQTLLLGFALGLVVGALGVWFHTDGHPLRGVGRVLSAWRLPPGDNGGIKPELSGPPAMAPFAFVGLGSIGLLACAPLRKSRPLS